MTFDFDFVLKYFLIFSVTLFSIKYFIRITPYLNLIDRPNRRSSHKKDTPRGAGIVMGIMFFVFFYLFESELFIKLIYPMVAFFMIYLCGIIDDLKTLSSKVKFIFIILATIILVYDGYVINYIGDYLTYNVYLGYLAIPFTIFAVVGFTNALNLIDGLDGLAAGITSIILFSLLLIGIIQEDQILITIPSFLLVIIGAFLVFNWNPARIFMGDSGSLFLGFVISFLSIQALEYITPSSVLFLAAIPVLDTMIVFRRRMQRSISPFIADKNHMHHILQNVKKDIKFTVSTIIMMQVAFSLIFLQIINSKDSLNLILFGVLYLIFFNLFDPRAKRRAQVDNKKIKKRTKRKRN